MSCSYRLEKIRKKKCCCNKLKKDNTLENILSCESGCNFCHFHNILEKYEVVKLLPYSKIKDIIGFKDIIENEHILFDIMDSKCDNISFRDLYIILGQHSLKNMKHSCIKKICGVVKINIIKSKMAKEYTKTTYKDSISIKILQKIINNESLLSIHYKTIMSFVLQLIELELINEVRDIGIQIADFSMLLELAFNNYGNKENAKSIIEYTEIELKSIHKIVNDGSFFRINQIYFKKLNALPYDLFEYICFKLDNIIEFITYSSNIAYLETIPIKINPTNVITSLKLDETSLETEIFLDNLSSIKNTYISYQTDHGLVGADAGGLTKDFYSLISSEILKYMEEIDGYLVPKKGLNINSNIWDFFGIIIARSIFKESLSPSLNLHPVVSYLMLVGIESINIKKFFNELEKFEIDYISNTQKVLLMNDEQYIEFMELQCEELIPRTKYIGGYICEKYLYTEAIQFINGFRKSFTRYTYHKFLTEIQMYRFLKSDWKYDIIGNTSNSLKNNLNIVNCTARRDDSKSEKFNMLIKEYFSKTFLHVLESLNNDDIEKLRSFFKFWYGTSSVSSFSSMNSTINIVLQKQYKCFVSHTCFNALDIETTDVKTTGDFDKEIMVLIDNSLKNQELSESVGFRMQFM